MNDPISIIDAENIERNATDAFKAMHKAIKQFQDFESKKVLFSCQGGDIIYANIFFN